jgi:hypothetical protein
VVNGYWLLTVYWLARALRALATATQQSPSGGAEDAREFLRFIRNPVQLLALQPRVEQIGRPEGRLIGLLQDDVELGNLVARRPGV